MLSETLKELGKMSIEDLEDLLFSFGDYEEPVPDINEFLDGDEYLGPFFQGTLRSYWRDALNEIYPNPYYSPHWLINLAGSIGVGKCHPAGTKIIMVDGSIKCVEDIVVGDCLLGPDSTPRTVQSTTTGRGNIYKITPTKGDAWYCNENHILTVVISGKNTIEDISVHDWLRKRTASYQATSKLFRVGVEFPDRSVEIDPYFLGLWLGDGNSCDQGVHTPEPEIKDYLAEYADRLGLSLVGKKGCERHTISRKRDNKVTNTLLESLRHYDLINNKHIPSDFLINSRENRLLLLAGLLDTDGYLCSGGYEITTKYDRLKDDILYLSRSLGFAAYESVKKVRLKGWDEPREYWRIFISGDTSVIPCRVQRKKAPERLQKKDVLRTGFKVSLDRVDDYYGFELDGDGRYLLGDFTVTHNSTIACAGIAYDLCKLLHMISPQKALGVIPTTKIIFSIFNVTLSLATDVVWDKLTQIFTASPYFSDLMGPLRTRVKTRDTIFPKRIDFSMGSRVGHSLGKDIYCLTGDTEVPLLNGTTERLDTLVSRVNSGETIYCYSYDTKRREIIPNKVRAGIVRGKKQTVKVTLDNGMSFRCTPDHRILTRDKRWVDAGDLKAGDSLLPFNLVKKGRYLVSYNPETKNHRAVSVECCGEENVYDIEMENKDSPNFALSCGVWAHNCAILDEANFEIVDGQISKTFNSLLRRMESRFMKRGGGVPGKIWIVSSETEKFAAVNTVVESYRGKKGVFICKPALWDVVPERYGDSSFWVYTGSEIRQPEVIDDTNLHLLKAEPDNCIEVPEEHRDSFVVDVSQSLRDLAGIPTGSNYRLFRLKDRLVKATAITSLFPDIIVLDFDNDEDQLSNYLKYDRYFDNPMTPGQPRFISVDIGLTGDRLGIAASHVERFVERKTKNMQLEEVVELIPIVNTEWAFAVEPTPGKQIPIWKIRTFIDWLSTKNYMIDRVTCDGFQSADFLQVLTHQGYTATLLSVDKTPAPYFKLRSMIYEGRSFLPTNKLLTRELEELLVSPKGDKVDHPSDYNSDRSKPSKDIADAVAASVYSAITEGNKNKLLYYQQSDYNQNGAEIMGTFWPSLAN